MTRRRKNPLILASLLALTVAVAGWLWKTRAPVLREVALDLKAGAKARHAQKPFERFLELRYGSMAEPTNRQAAFLGFFNPDHLKGRQRLVGFMSAEERQNNISATAHWIENYRETMTAAERDALAAWLHSDEGRARLQRASALYRSQDIRYRSATEPVIRELMTTLAWLQESAPAP